MHGGAAEVFVADGLADGRFDQRGAGEIQTTALRHEQFVAQDGQVAAAGHAVAEDGRELRHAGRRDDGVVAEDAAEVVLVGKNLVLERQEDAGAVHEVDERQAVFQGDALGAERLLAGHRKEGAGLDRGVVGDDHHGPALDGADPGDDAGRRGAAPVAVHAPGRPQAEFKEVGARIEQPGDALAGGETALGVLALDRLGPAALADHVFLAPERFDPLGEFVGHFADPFRAISQSP